MPRRVPSIAGQRRQPLSAGWELCSTPPDACTDPAELARASLTWTPAHAPSTVAECLREAKLWSLDDPPRRLDALDWWYRVRFDAPDHGPDTDVVLGFDGLATVADAWLNGVPLLRSDNMFLAHERLLEQPLARTNELVIRFRALDKLLEARRPRPRWRAPMVENQQLRWFRTTLLGRTPGWSPPAAPVGPWRPIWIETREHVRLENFGMRTGIAGDDGWIEVAADIVAVGPAPVTAVTLAVSRADDRFSVQLRRASASSYGGRLEISEVERWWPHTHGEPALYHAKLAIALAGSPDAVEVDLGHVGFRSITIDTQADDFALHINGVPVFCRGACWTPDPVTLRESPESLRETLGQARAAGMNMLRVGGTMVYEDDSFLDLCDACGILLWQDFMFANMSYPEEDPAFIASVTAEARQQLARLAGRPCLAVLCGNSEAEQQAAMWGAPRGSWETELFNTLLPNLAREICPDVPYWPSSAHGGSFPHQTNVGTASYYGVGAYLRPLEDARRAEVRFASECLAFANIPENSTIAHMPGGQAIRCHHAAWKARSPRDLGAGWDFDDVRDHYLARLFRVDPLELRYSDHDRYLTLGRVVTGEVMASVFAEWRRKRSPCRGGLIWFWRDLWPGAGWGVVDSLGTAKAAFHYLRRALQPVCVTISDEGANGLFLNVINERPTPLVATLDLTLYRAGEVVTGNATKPLEVPARETLELSAASMFDSFVDLSYAYRFGPPAHDLVVASLRAGHGEEPGPTLSQAFHLVAGPGIARELDVGLQASATARPDSGFDVKIAARRFAQSVWIEADGFEAADAYFHVAPGSETTVHLRPTPRAAARPLRGRIHALNALNTAKIEIV